MPDQSNAPVQPTGSPLDYPPPAIPLSPVLSWHGIPRSGNALSNTDANSILTNTYLLHVTSGRAAIALALERSGITRGDEVLIPAYHCESMVSPARWLDANPVFYKINMDTTFDIDDIKRKLSTNTRAIIVTHYFGFIQNMPALVKLCEQQGIVLIEDCAHAFFGSKNGRGVGTWGDYAIASSMKFFPVYDGGILASSRKPIDSVILRSSSPFFQIKSLLNVVQVATKYKRLGIPGKILKHLTDAAEAVWGFSKNILGREQSGIYAPSSSGGGYGLDEEWIHHRASWFSTAVIKHQSKDRIADARRKNYLRLYDALSKLPNSHPLFDELPEGTVPLVFPLYVDEPAQHFDCLKRIGVPIWRFGEYLDSAITDEVCRNSVDLSAHVFQFPCHQELTKDDMDWMINQVKRQLHKQADRV